jgi:hypothetical protein
MDLFPAIVGSSAESRLENFPRDSRGDRIAHPADREPDAEGDHLLSHPCDNRLDAKPLRNVESTMTSSGCTAASAISRRLNIRSDWSGVLEHPGNLSTDASGAGQSPRPPGSKPGTLCNGATGAEKRWIVRVRVGTPKLPAMRPLPFARDRQCLPVFSSFFVRIAWVNSSRSWVVSALVGG